MFMCNHHSCLMTISMKTATWWLKAQAPMLTYFSNSLPHQATFTAVLLNDDRVPKKQTLLFSCQKTGTLIGNQLALLSMQSAIVLTSTWNNHDVIFESIRRPKADGRFNSPIRSTKDRWVAHQAANEPQAVHIWFSEESKRPQYCWDCVSHMSDGLFDENQNLIAQSASPDVHLWKLTTSPGVLYIHTSQRWPSS